MIRLLNFCVISLKEQGMRKMFLDAILGGYEGFQSIGKAAQEESHSNQQNSSLTIMCHRIP